MERSGDLVVFGVCLLADPPPPKEKKQKKHGETVFERTRLPPKKTTTWRNGFVADPLPPPQKKESWRNGLAVGFP